MTQVKNKVKGSSKKVKEQPAAIEKIPGFCMLNLGGKERGFKWGRWAFELYFKKRKEEQMRSAHDALALYCGLRYYLFAKELPIDFTFENATDWYDTLDVETLKIIEEAINTSPFTVNALKDK